MKHTYQYQRISYPIDLTPSGKTYRATLEGRTVTVELLRAEAGQLDLLIDGVPTSANITVDGPKRWITIDGHTLLLTKTAQTRKGPVQDERNTGQIISPMPGQVRAVQTAPGDPVTKGQTLLIVEAMKMEIKLTAPFDGRVKTLLATIGQTVDKDQLLLELEPTISA